jgi:hypothetical protein
MYKLILISLTLMLTACEGFKFQGTMCDSMQPGQVSTECHPYSEEEAAEASFSPKQREEDPVEYQKDEPVEFKE